MAVFSQYQQEIIEIRSNCCSGKAAGYDNISMN